MELQEIRCKKCRRLLFKVSPDTRGTIQAHCKKCNNVVTFTLPFQQETVVKGKQADVANAAPML
jgi:phage FluMu protein Com